MSPREVSVCLTPPGFDADLIVQADVAVLYRVWLGRTDYDIALRRGDIEVRGPPALVRAAMAHVEPHGAFGARLPGAPDELAVPWRPRNLNCTYGGCRRVLYYPNS
jgi:hypothetical protein